MSSPLVKLSNGVEMPQVGLGTWQSSVEEVKAAVHAAFDAGYRLIDTASLYHNEEAIGEALQEAIAAGKLKREDVFITTKAWASQLHPDEIEGYLRDSLRKLKVDYVDLLLAHTATYINENDKTATLPVTEIWKGFENVYNKKLTRAIGVSNWSGEQIERVMKTATVPIHNVQVEIYLYWPQNELHEICKKHNISLTSYGTLGSPGRVNWVTAVVKWAPAPSPLDDENVKNIAAKYGKSPAQILLRHMLQRGILIIPKSVKPERVQENFQLFDFELTSEDIKLIETVPHRQRLFFHNYAEGHQEDPFKAERKP